MLGSFVLMLHTDPDAMDGYVYGRWGLQGVVIADVMLLVMWLIVAFGIRVPSTSSTRTYTVPRLTSGKAEALLTQLRLLPRP
jgi:hypothetical protein